GGGHRPLPGRARGAWDRDRHVVRPAVGTVPPRLSGDLRLGEGSGRRRRARLVVRPGPGGRRSAVSEMAAAYAQGAQAWAEGPTRIYERLARVLVDFSPVPLAGRLVLDLGSGTGAGSRAAIAAGARVIAAD